MGATALLADVLFLLAITKKARLSITYALNKHVAVGQRGGDFTLKEKLDHVMLCMIFDSTTSNFSAVWMMGSALDAEPREIPFRTIQMGGN